MHIVILAVGSRGDVQPYVALGRGFQRAGHAVRLATSEEFACFVKGAGLDFAPVAGNPRASLAEDSGQRWLDSGRNGLLFVYRLVRLLRPFLDHFLTSCWDAGQGADAVVYSPLGFAGYHIAEKLGVPGFAASVQPLGRSRFYANLIVPPNLQLPGSFNWASHLIGEQLTWQLIRPGLSRWRRRRLGLPAEPFFGPFDRMYREPKVPFLYGFSQAVVPRPPDWPTWHHVTGYWCLERPAGWTPPPDLVDFLKAGPPPVSVGFGSMATRDADAIVEATVAGLRQAGRRGILLAGWSRFGQKSFGDDVFLVDEVPHDWLFPQMAAIVHHGGAGTTAAALRSGVPSIAVPFFADQPFWAQRIGDLGVGPAPIPRKELSAERLATAIDVATTDRSMQARARALGERLRTEDGVAAAVEAFSLEVQRA